MTFLKSLPYFEYEKVCKVRIAAIISDLGHQSEARIIATLNIYRVLRLCHLIHLVIGEEHTPPPAAYSVNIPLLPGEYSCSRIPLWCWPPDSRILLGPLPSFLSAAVFSFEDLLPSMMRRIIISDCDHILPSSFISRCVNFS